jgi:hypothetical protein
MTTGFHGNYDISRRDGEEEAGVEMVNGFHAAYDRTT